MVSSDLIQKLEKLHDTSYNGGIAMLIIDPQNDFHPANKYCSHNGSLAVQGAVEDSERITQFINMYQKCIQQINITLDSHQSIHIAHSIFWKDSNGQKPQAFTIISMEDIVSGKWSPVNNDMKEYCIEYTKTLEKSGRFKLCIWPEHCIIGSPGHNIIQNVHEEALNWARKNCKRINYVMKGSNSFTEHYSALRADVEIPFDTSTSLNSELVHSLKRADVVVICGEALSHCVNFTTRDLVKNWKKDQLHRIVLLSDCASSVPGFEESGKKFIDDMKFLGLTVCTSSEFQYKCPNAESVLSS